VGLRPENFEDASLVSDDNRPNGITFDASIDVLESMGSDVFVYFTQGREQGVTAAELEELARDSGRADTGGSGDTIVARLDAATTIREGHDAELWVDGRSMHVFDPASGRNLSLAAAADSGGAAAGGAAPTAAGTAAGGAAAGTQAADSATQEASGMAAQGRHAAADDTDPADPGPVSGGTGSGGSGGEVT
jgi:hypothetical protein